MKLSLQDIEVKGKRCLVRVDFNVPLEEQNGEIVVADDTRIVETLPTLRYLQGKEAKIILCSHLGRPKGKRDPKQSLQPVAKRLEQLLSTPVGFVEDCVGPEAQTAVTRMAAREVLLLENLRFYAEEEKNDEPFAQKLAKLAEVYVNDAFGSSHRAHASTAAVAKFIPVAVAGLLMQKELQFLGEELKKPDRPFVVILGGAKVSDKIMVIEALLEKAQTLLIGGAMAYTFDLALGKKIGNSLCEPEKVDLAHRVLEKAKQKNVKLLLPVDRVIAQEVDFSVKKVSSTQTISGDIPEGWQGVDIGPKTIGLYSKEIEQAATILWNGPMGIFEISDCAQGTFAIAQAVAANRKAKSIIGGGDSAKAIKEAGVAERVSFISTGGGAALELLEGKTLPGVAALNERQCGSTFSCGCH